MERSCHLFCYRLSTTTTSGARHYSTLLRSRERDDVVRSEEEERRNIIACRPAIYNLIHHQTMIANNQKQTNRNNKHLSYINY